MTWMEIAFEIVGLIVLIVTILFLWKYTNATQNMLKVQRQVAHQQSRPAISVALNGDPSGHMVWEAKNHSPFPAIAEVYIKAFIAGTRINVDPELHGFPWPLPPGMNFTFPVSLANWAKECNMTLADLQKRQKDNPVPLVQCYVTYKVRRMDEPDDIRNVISGYGYHYRADSLHWTSVMST